MKQTRNTAQKLLIRDLLVNNDTHPTADEVYELARKNNPSISRGTIYRNLNLLADSGEILRLKMPTGPDHFDSRTYHHYHFLCRRCYRVIDTGLPYDNTLNQVTPDLPGCKTEFHRLIFVGLCPDCNHEIKP